MKVTAIMDYYDIAMNRGIRKGEMFDTDDERAVKLTENGLVTVFDASEVKVVKRGRKPKNEAN